jgi:hypothetical protein
MKQMKYIKLFEEYTTKDFIDTGKDNPKFSGSLEPEHQEVFDRLKELFGKEPSITTTDNIDGRDIEIQFLLNIYKTRSVSLRIFIDTNNKYFLSFAVPTNAEENYEKEFSNKDEMFKFIQKSNLSNFLIKK